MTAHAEQAENLGAYALGALPDLEASVFERHLMGCQECQEELALLRPAVDALPRSVTPYDPPPALKESLMATVRAEAARPAPAAAEAARPEPALAPARRAAVRPRWRLPRFAPALAAAAAAFLLAVVLVPGADDDSRTLTADVRLSGSAELSVGDGEAVLRVDGMPSPGKDRIYQVWVQRGDDVVPVSIFDVDRAGDGAAAIPEDIDGVDAVMVTRERRGGAQAPSETPILSVEV